MTRKMQVPSLLKDLLSSAKKWGGNNFSELAWKQIVSILMDSKNTNQKLIISLWDT